MMDHVDMPGFVEDAAPYVRRAHCALTCSRSEAFGRATAEALTSGIPVIGHASGGTPELIEAGTTGLLYTEPAELQAQMLHLATHPEVARSMGQAARAGRTAQRHIEAVAQEVVRVYWAVLARAAP
jgi:glycosyltransferase involved in cell wall biosynthesis